jgi:hypothetical protein
MRRSSSSHAIALFPFLAVLVCAMGALILLLLVTAQTMQKVAMARALAAQAAEEAAEDAEVASGEPEAVMVEAEQPESENLTAGPQLAAPTKPTQEELAAQEAERRAVRIAREARKQANEEAKGRQMQREQEWQRALADLEAKRTEKREEVREFKKQLGDLESRLQRTELNLQKLKEREQQLASKKEQDADERAKLDKLHQELTDAITARQKEIAELRKTHAEESSKFAFIPYDGLSGTTRRPIYLECTASGIRFQPEGVRLDEDDLKGFTESQNPLLAATHAVMEHLQKTAPLDPKTKRPSRPYVLMLVRPSGTISYYVARKMLSEIGDDFGYELIEDDFELQLPAGDGKTKTVIERAIADALRLRGEAIAEGSRVGETRLGQVRMGRSEESIEFDTLNDQKAAAAVQKESPFSKHSTRQGKNFSITRSPVKQEELLPDTFRTELDSHNERRNTTSAGNSASSSGSGPGGAHSRNGMTAGAKPGSAAGPGTGSGQGTGLGGRSGTGSRNGSGQNDGSGGIGGDAVALGQGSGTGGNASGTSGSPVLIQRGGRLPGQATGSGGFGTGGSGTTNSIGTSKRIQPLPTLTDPFSRQQSTHGMVQNGTPGGDDSTLGYSGGNVPSGTPGSGPAGSRAGAGTNALGVAGVGGGPAGGNIGDATGTAGGSQGNAVAGVRSAKVFDLQPGSQLGDQGGNIGEFGAAGMEPGVSGDATTGTRSGIPGSAGTTGPRGTLAMGQSGEPGLSNQLGQQDPLGSLDQPGSLSQSGQSGQLGLSDPFGQPGQRGQSGQGVPPGQPGQTGQSDSTGQAMNEAGNFEVAGNSPGGAQSPNGSGDFSQNSGQTTNRGSGGSSAGQQRTVSDQKSSGSGSSSGGGATSGGTGGGGGVASSGGRSRGGRGAASGAGNPFDKTQGKAVADEFTEDAQRQLASADDAGQHGRKSYGANPQDDDRQRSKPKHLNLTPSQKQSYGRQRWGGSNIGQIGFERKVPVQVLADKIVIGKDEVEIEIEPGTTRDELTTAMLDGLDAYSQTWEKPPKKFYWVPYLEFEVHKGGVVQYEQLHGPLREWGLFSEVKFKDGVPGEHGLIQPVSKNAAGTVKAAPKKDAKPGTQIPQKPPVTKKKGIFGF